MKLNAVLTASAFLLLVGLLVRAHSFEVAQAGVQRSGAVSHAVPYGSGETPGAAGAVLGDRALGARERAGLLRTPRTQDSGRVPVAASVGGTTRSGSIRAIRRVFGRNSRAERVARCESHLHAHAVSSTGDYGLFQLHRSIWDPALNPRAKPYWPRGKDWSDVFDPYVNARVAWAISRRGTDFWTHWRWSSGCWA